MFAAGYVQTNLVSDGFVPAVTVDADLKNPWGVTYSPSGPFWVANNGTGTATIYNGNGVKQSLVVNIPGAGGDDAAPTGQVFNDSSRFVISNGAVSAPALFIFVGEDGGITGWNPTVNQTNAILARDDSSSAAIYKGATIARINGKPFLYATDFHNNKVAVFNGAFQPVTLKSGAFVDPNIPDGFAPFNVQAVGKNLVVTYAKQDADKEDDVAGPGNGYVDIFNTSGKLLRRIQHTDDMNAPWGVAVAPKNFGTFSGSLLIGQFGSGRIVAFDPNTGQEKGLLRNTQGDIIENEGLWALKFGNGSTGASKRALFFTAGLNDEADGLFGKLVFQKAGATT